MNLPDIELEEAYIKTNRTLLHTVLSGPRGGRPVILLHGFPEFWRGWVKQIPALASAGYRVIVPDQRGYNLSDKPKGIKSYRMKELVNDIIGLADALGYEKVNLVGHDWGAAVAWTLAIWYPERSHRLGILNVPHPAVMSRFLLHDLEQLRRSWYIFLFQLPWLPEGGMRAQDWRGAMRALRGSGKVHTFSDEDVEKYKEAWSQPGAITSMINWYRAAARYPSGWMKDQRVHVPTLMLWGKNDVALTHSMAQPSIDLCDDGRLVFFEQATHWVQHEEAEAVNRYLVDFFST